MLLCGFFFGAILVLTSYGSDKTEAQKLFDSGVQAENQQKYIEAFQFYQKSAELGLASAQYAMGEYYSNGDWYPKDYAEAVKWY